jgi:queuine tRNA-ribosyltransferase
MLRALRFPVSFVLDSTDGAARAGRMITPHGTVETPQFMPVGTRGALRGLSPIQAREAGATILLANAYHLALKPGADRVKRFGGLHRFMAWDGPILTDSGGFQVFSLPGRTITEQGVSFKKEHDGRPFTMSPESSMEIQGDLGADIIMAFDECVAFPAEHKEAEVAVGRSTRWLERCVRAWDPGKGQGLFGIVQGSTFRDLRERAAREVCAMDLPGYAIGGLAVGEGLEAMDQVLSWTAPLLPEDRPRYVMGIGLARDLLAAIDHGIDLFDCVVPTRHARGGVAHGWRGRMRLTQPRFRKDRLPIDTSCGCYCCRNFARGVLHHLLTSNEILGTTLLAIHNIHFLTELCAAARGAISERRWSEFRAEVEEGLGARS